MKRCNACDEEFKDKYSFCPVDATPLNSLAAAVVGGDANYYEQINSRAPDKETRVTGIVPFADREFRVTMIDTAALPKRLATEIRFMALQMRLGWPAAKQDPIGFGRRALLASRLHIGSALAAPNSMAGIVAALALVLTVAMIVLLSGRFSDDKGVDPGADANLDNEEVVQIVEFMPESKVNPQDRGVGLGSHGRVGLARGRGEGSAPKPRKATGGGGGGQNDPMPAQQGRPPQPSTIPAPIPKFPPVQKHVLPVAGVDIDPALWSNLPMPIYGDPRSKSTSPSSGPGDAGGMGNSNGTGIGEGSGPGFGPGEDGNIGGGRKGPPGGGGIGGSSGNNPDDPDRIYRPLQVTERARVISKPEPQYTEDARRNQITGSVILRAVFSRTGEVTNIRTLHALPFGLTERAIAAARRIQFRPATKDGRPVNVYMQLEYNFNLY